MALVPLEQANPFLYRQWLETQGQPQATLQQTQAAAGAEGAAAGLSSANTPGAIAESQIKQKDLSQVQQLQDSGKVFSSTKSLTPDGKVDPQVYNSEKAKYVNLGGAANNFDSAYEPTYTSPVGIGYDTATSRANNTEFQQTKAQIQTQLDAYNAIPANQKGIYGKANLPNQNIMQVALNSPGLLGDRLQAEKQGAANYLQKNANEALTYEGQRVGVAGELKDLLGSKNARQTQFQLGNWANLLPSASDDPKTAQDKIQALDRQLQATYHTNGALDPKYLPQQQSTPGVISPVGGSQGTPLQQAGVLPNTQNNTPPSDTTGNFIKTIGNFLPLVGGVAGGAVGGMAGAGVGAIPGAALGAGAGQVGNELLNGQMKPADLIAMLTGVHQGSNPVSNQEALAAGGEAGGRALGGILGNLSTKEGQALATGPLNLSASQMNKYAIENGESVAKTLNDNGLTGAGLDKLKSAIEPLNNIFQETVKDPNFSVSKDVLDKNFQSALDEISSAPTGQQQALKEALQKEYDSVVPTVFGDETKIQGKIINGLRQQYDSQTSAAGFNADPVGENVSRTMGTVLRRSLQQSPGGEVLQGTGNTMSKLIDLSTLAAKRVGVGGTGKTITRAAIGAGLGFLTHGNPVGGMIAAEAAGKATENPLIASLLSKGFSGAGKSLSQGALGGGLGASGNTLLQLLGMSAK